MIENLVNKTNDWSFYKPTDRVILHQRRKQKFLNIVHDKWTFVTWRECPRDQIPAVCTSSAAELPYDLNKSTQLTNIF